MMDKKNKWPAFSRHYFGRYREFLENVWFCSQGYTLKNIRERVAVIKKTDYDPLQDELKFYDIEANTEKIVQHCFSLLGYPETPTVYLFIGFFSPDAFVLKRGDDYVVCVGLERFRSFRHYPVLLAHELCHYVQNKRLGETGTNILERIIREGISVYFSKLAYPGRMENHYLFMKRGACNFLQEGYKEIRKKILNIEELTEDIFHGLSGSFPPRAGYYIGYRLVQEFMEKTGESDFEYLIENYRSIIMDFKGQ